MKTTSGSTPTCDISTGFLLSPTVVLLALLALVLFPSSSALAIPRCESVEFSESGGYPFAVFVDATTATSGATILATMGIGFIPASPTHGDHCSPTGSTFIWDGPYGVPFGQLKYIKAIACKAGYADSFATSYVVDNTGN
jgi:hypothetical protein